MPTATFTTELRAFGNNTGIEVPDDAVATLGAGRKPPVHVDVDGYRYDSTVAVMGGANLIPLNKAHREASGLVAGQTITVTLTLIEGERTVDVPEALRAALAEAGLQQTFDALSYSRRKEHARQVAEAKKPETAQRRIDKVLADLG